MNRRITRARATTVRRRTSGPPLLNEEERDWMRRAAQFNAELMDYIRPHVQAGITTEELNRLAYDYTVAHGHVPAPLQYEGFPKSICTSINEVVCHGIPNYRVLKSGDIINVDLTSKIFGKTAQDTWHGDQSETFLIGDVTEEARRLVQVCFECLWKGIDAVRPYGRVIDIGNAISAHAHAHGFSVVEEYLGHGIGREFHCDPSIPHFPHGGSANVILRPGMCFTIEPMINAGAKKTIADKTDGWTVRTADGRLSAQFEHTILLTESGVEVLTLTKNGPQRGHQF